MNFITAFKFLFFFFLIVLRLKTFFFCCYLMSLESVQNCFGDQSYNDILIEAINEEITNARNNKKFRQLQCLKQTSHSIANS